MYPNIFQLLLIPRSRGNIDAMTQGRPRVETSEASSYSWCLQSC